MSYKTEFPDYDGELYIPDGFIDTSWHNDIMPHVSMIRQTADGNEIVYNIWQDYVNKNLREYENTKRYAFAIVVNEEYVFEKTTDDLEVIKELVGGIYI